MRVAATIWSEVLAGVGLTVQLTVAQAAVDYNRDIKPLLAKQCVQCHGATQQKGGLRLDTAAAALAGGKLGPAILAGNAAQSPLVQSLLGIHPEIDRMPYKRAPLDSQDIARIQEWINSGAMHTANEVPSSDRHWAFVPPVLPVIPHRASSPASVRNPVDEFVLSQLQKHQLGFSPEAPPRSLLRRVALDLTGLQPSPEEYEEFERDRSPGAYERAVDRLLASPHYGERWGRWWLDAARYADSNGYSIDSPRSLWPYRDWVVQAFNSDLPFDRFTILQLAGDLLESDSPHERRYQQLATGFHRNTQVNHEGGVDPEQFRIESVMDRVNTTATVWLGITLGCAQCHDHKFDPFSMRDYYQFLAYFNSCENDGHGSPTLEALNKIEIGTPEQLAELKEFQTQLDQLNARLQSWIDAELKPKQTSWESGLSEEARQKLKPEIQASLAVPTADRNEFQKATVFNHFRDSNPEYQQRKKEVDTFRRKQPILPTSLVMKELPSPRETRIFIKGDFTRPGEVVTAGTPVSLTRSTKQPNASTRLDLARWLVSAENPLTSRVLVNRVWQQYFGKGLVETENDFGTQGATPTHPELLDWLAVSFMQHGWSLKQLHRTIVTSTTYRQSSSIAHHVPSSASTASAPPRGESIDPLNRLLWRQNRLRLDAEIIRDSMLVGSGLLDRTLGGPPVFPPQPPGLDAFTQNKREWKTSAGAARYRRALYTHLQRTTYHPALLVFDASDGYFTCTRRTRSNTPLQALTLLNDPAFTEFAEGLGRRLSNTTGSDTDRIQTGFVLCLGRSPKDHELKTLSQLLATERQSGLSSTDTWISVARVLLNLDETITRE